jgi:hypothetical protein
MHQIKYFEFWMELYRELPELMLDCQGPATPNFFDAIAPCSCWRDCLGNFLCKYSKLGLQAFQDLDELFTVTGMEPDEDRQGRNRVALLFIIPECCERTLRLTRRKVKERIEQIPSRPFGR